MRVVATTLLLLSTARATGAQTVGPSSPCLDTLSASALRRVPVFLEPILRDSTARLALPSIQLIADDAAARVRKTLAAGADELPRAPGAVSWRGLDGTEVAAMLHRDGRVTAAPVRGGDAGALALLTTAVRLTSDSSGPYFWDERVPGDSLAFRLTFRHPEVDSAGTVAPMRSRFAVPAFSLAVPWSSPIRPRKRPSMVYPPDARLSGVVGTVVLQFVVDTAGRVDLTSARDLWREDRPRLTGELGQHYERFVESGVRALAAASYVPARIGGCPVRQRVTQEMQWTLTP